MKSNANNIRILIVLFIVFIVGIAAFAGSNIINNTLNQTPTHSSNLITPSPTPYPVNPAISSPNTIIYGVWSSSNSIIKSYNLQTGVESIIAVLPQNIKKITMVLPDSLYYINNTDKNDHGTEIVRYTISNQQYQTVTKASNRLGIDDYYLSPNSKYLATWEIRLNERAGASVGHTVLWGGQSSVYGIDLTKNNTKTLLYNENGKSIVHYPRGVTNEGGVITDKFLPNSGPGWAYGMSSVNVSGVGNYDSAQMINGSYGRQPRISSDGTQLAFAGYDGKYGLGTEEIDSKNKDLGKVRRAIIVPNTVEIISSVDLTRKKLLALSNANIIDDVRFDNSGKYLFVTILKKEPGRYTPQVLLYNLQDNSPEAVPNSANKRPLAYISDSQILLSSPNAQSSSMGNLGESYQFVNGNFEIVNPLTQESVVIPITDINLQYIGIFANSELPSFILQPNNNQLNNSAKKTLQLQTFVLKTSLLPDRMNLESRPLNADNSNVMGAKTIAQANPTIAFPSLPLLPTISSISPGDANALNDLKRQTEELIGQTNSQPDLIQLLLILLLLINILESMIQN